jgi:hypothetical protein
MMARPAAAWQSPGGSGPVPLSEYWKLVEHTQEILAGPGSVPAGQGQTAIAELIDQWEAVQEVRSEDGEIIPLDNSYLLSVLRTAGNDPEPARGLFEALLEAHREYPARLFTPADLEGLNTILARPDFQWPEEAGNPIVERFNELLQRFFRWLNHLLGRDRNGTRPISPAGFSLFPVLMTILLALVIVYVLRGLFADLVKETKLDTETDAADMPLTAEAAFVRAQSLSQSGDYRSAVRYLYLSSLLLLDERGLLRYDRSKTNREYLRSVSGSPELSEPLNEVIEVFDNVWYGYHALDEESFQHYSERVEELKEKKQP